MATTTREAPEKLPLPADPRTVRARQPLPTGRAVVGGFLVAVAALGIFVAWSSVSSGPSDRYVVARRDLAIGTRLAASDLVAVEMQLPAVAVRSSAFPDARRLVGATVIGPIRKGELVQAGSVLRRSANAGQREVSFAIETARAVAGGLKPGEFVDVLATFGAGDDAYTVAVVRGARVLSADRRSSNLADGRSETVTLAVRDEAEALALAHAVNAGEITLVRAESSSSGGEAPVYRAPRAASEAET